MLTLADHFSSTPSISSPIHSFAVSSPCYLLPPLPVHGGLALPSCQNLPSLCPSRSSPPFLIHLSNNRLSGSKKLNTIATAIGLKPKKTHPPTPIEEPASPVLPIHTGDIESPARPTKSAVKPVSVAVGWADPQAVQHEFLEAYPQSVFSTDLDPFAAAAKYPHGPPNVSESLRFSTFSEVSTLESHARKDAPHARNRTSFTSSSSLSHQRSDITTADSSPISSPFLSPVMSRRHLSR